MSGSRRTTAYDRPNAVPKICFLAIAGTLLSLAGSHANAFEVVVGVNVTGTDRLNEQQQDALVEELRQNGVKVVRSGIGPKFAHFTIRAWQNGIRVLAGVPPTAGGSAAHMRAADQSLGLEWVEPGITGADPVKYKVWLEAQLATLESSGVYLAAFELGNEINTAGFNGDFDPTLASGRELGLAELDNPDDPEGRAIAASYRAYLKMLAVLKDVRDRSRLNTRTPIISAGLADSGPPGRRPGQKLDGVSAPATLQFLQRNGLDELVDGYGAHFYPSNQDPSRPVSERIEGLGERALALCTRAKPCWLTEWGFPNSQLSCPIDDEKRERLVRTEREAFQVFVNDGKLVATIYYNWQSLPGFEVPSIFRCGELTVAGKLALQPIVQQSARK